MASFRVFMHKMDEDPMAIAGLTTKFSKCPACPKVNYCHLGFWQLLYAVIFQLKVVFKTGDTVK